MNTNKAAEAFHRSARISRAELYGVPQDRQLPAHLVEDARIPFLGFAGSQFQPGGVVLLAINPGGGGDAYQRRTMQDAQLLPLIEAFTKSSGEEITKHFVAMSSNYAAQVRTWNLWRIFAPVLQACGKEMDEVIYLNCFPYRTAGDRMPQAAALRASWAKVVEPLLSVLNPAIVVALGKKVGGVAEQQFKGPGKLYVVPRTIGDTRVSEEAKVVLEALRKNAIRPRHST
jgi:hypothetical protein